MQKVECSNLGSNGHMSVKQVHVATFSLPNAQKQQFLISHVHENRYFRLIATFMDMVKTMDLSCMYINLKKDSCFCKHTNISVKKKWACLNSNEILPTSINKWNVVLFTYLTNNICVTDVLKHVSKPLRIQILLFSGYNTKFYIEICQLIIIMKK